MLATKYQVLLDIILYLLAVVSLRGVIAGKKRNNVPQSFSVVLVFLFLLFAYWGGDFFHYLDGYNYVKSKSSLELSFEPVYYYIVSLSPSYLFFRMWVWGTCLVLVLLIFKKLNISIRTGLLFFVSLALLRVSYARVSLAMAIMYLGLTIFELKDKKFLYTVLGIVIIGLSFFFHKSAYFGIAMILTSIIMTNYYKKGINWFLILVFFVFAFGLVYFNIEDLMKVSSEDMDSTYNLDVAQKYLSREGSETGWGAQLRNLLEVVPYYMGLVLYIKLYRKKSIKELPKEIKAFTYLFLIIILVASVFALDFGFNTIFLSHRFMRFNLIPLTILVAYCFQHGIEKKWCLGIFYVGLLVSLFTLYYSYSHAQ